MTAPVFVDTNVFVYARDARAPDKQQRAHAWLELLWQEQTGRTSIQVLSEYLVAVTRKLPLPLAFEDAWDDVAALMTWEPQVIDREVMSGAQEAVRRHSLLWWDALVVSAARLQGCPMLLSEDLQDGATLLGVTVRSPFTLALSEAPKAYRTSRRAR